MILLVISWGAVSYAAATAVTPLIRRLALKAGCVSRPKPNRWGRRVVPRLGGIAIALGFLAATAWGATQDPRLWGLFWGGLLISVIGMVDDFHTLPPNSKLVAQIVTGCLVVLSGVHADLPFNLLTIPVTIGWLVLIMNAFNLMDNMDGLSAGIGAITGSFCTWHALQTGQVVPAVVSAALTGSTLGFLQYNLPPAKIFMGDTGSQILGLGLGSLALLQTWHQPARLLGMVALPTLLLAVPIFDTLFVTLQRVVNKRSPFQGGTDHTSHRLGLMGLSPRQVVFVLYSLTAVLGAIGVAMTYQHPIAIIGVWLLAIATLIMLGSCLALVRVYTGPPLPAEEPKSTWIDTMLTHKRRLVEVGVDFVLVSACYVVAHALRFEASITPDVEQLILQSLPWIILTKMSCLFIFGVYRGIWRYISLADLANIFRAVLCGSLLSAVLVLYLWRFHGYSRAVFIIDGLLLFVLIGGSRVMEPLLNEWILSSRRGVVPVLIVGAGDTGELLLQQFRLQLNSRRVVGFLDDDLSKVGNRIHGVPVLGTRRELGSVVQRYSIQELVVAMHHPPEELLQKIKGYCEENGIAWKVSFGLLSRDRTSAPPQA